MSAISWSDTLEAYLMTLGYPEAWLEYVEQFVQLFCTTFPTVAEDVGLIEMLEKNFRDFLQGLYQINLLYGFSSHVPAATEAQVEAWFNTYRPELGTAIAEMMDDAYEIWLNVVPTAPLAETSPNGTSTTTTEAQRYQMASEEMLRKIIGWVRHFVTSARVYDSNANAQNAGNYENPALPTSDKPGVSEFDYGTLLID